MGKAESKQVYLQHLQKAVVDLDVHRFQCYMRRGVWLFGTVELGGMLNKQLPLLLGGFYTKRLIMMMEQTVEEERRR
jgi:hypothetical protein